MKKLAPILLFVCLLILIGLEMFVSKQLFDTSKPFLGVRTLFNFSKIVLFCSLIYSILKAFNLQIKIRYLSFLVGLTILLLLSYFTSKSDFYYHILKISKRGWSEQIYQQDDTLGYKHVSNFNGFRIVPYAPKVAVDINDNGNRIASQNEHHSNADSTVLFLGCSYTFGDACKVEETFAYEVAVQSNLNTINGGVCGYGLTQMLLKAKELIPKIQPDYVVVQYSPWLIDRAVYPFSPNIFGKVPTPMARMEYDSLVISPPVFKSKVFDLPIQQFNEGYKTFGQYLKFYFSVGLKLAIHDEIKVIGYRIREYTGKVKMQDFAKSKEVAGAMYQQFYNICKANNTKMIVLALGQDYQQEDELLQMIAQNDDIILVNAEQALWDNLNTPTQAAYNKSYKHWSTLNGQEIMVDEHPNALAHKIIAVEILKGIFNYNH